MKIASDEAAEISASKGVLAGVRVLDLTRVWAGPLAARMLADFGAQVIRISDPRVPIDRSSGTFNKLNRNKLGVALRLDTPAGRDMFLRLVEVSDLVVENFRPRVMRNFGLTYEDLRAVRPDVILASMPGFGTQGGYADYPAFGPSVETMTGITSLMGYAGGPPMPSSIAYPDAVSAMNSSGAIMAALWHRRRTGQGQFIDVALSEGPVCQIGEYVVAESGGTPQPAPSGNAPADLAPYDCYPAAGDDRWVAVCVTSEDQWRALCVVMDSPLWTREERFSDMAARCGNRPELDELIAGWTATQDATELTRRLQEAGIPAGAVLDAKGLLEDPHLNERGFFVEIAEPGLGTFKYPGQAVRMSATPPVDWLRHAPALGEHTSAVLEGLLQVSREELDALESQGVLGRAPP